MSLPGWAHPCSCGQVPRGYFCTDCRGFGSGFAGQAGTHTIPPRDVQRPAEEPTPEPEATPTPKTTPTPWRGGTLGH